MLFLGTCYKLYDADSLPFIIPWYITRDTAITECKKLNSEADLVSFVNEREKDFVIGTLLLISNFYKLLLLCPIIENLSNLHRI